MKKRTINEKKAILDGLIELFNQNRRWLLFFGTGTSCAMDKRLGMPKLAEHLLAKLPLDAQGWPDVRSRLEGRHNLEQALTEVALPAITKSLIQREVGDYVAAIDRELRDDVLTGRTPWVGGPLLNALGQRLPPVNPRLSVVTSNYDMLIEYSCARSGLRYTSGHVGEFLPLLELAASPRRSDKAFARRTREQTRARTRTPSQGRIVQSPWFD